MNLPPAPYRLKVVIGEPQLTDLDSDDLPYTPVMLVADDEGGCTVACLGDAGLDPECPREVNERDAERLAASWNACADLPDPSVVPELVEVLHTLFRRAHELDQSATSGGLRNCDALAAARGVLRRCGKVDP